MEFGGKGVRCMVMWCVECVCVCIMCNRSEFDARQCLSAKCSCSLARSSSFSRFRRAFSLLISVISFLSCSFVSRISLIESRMCIRLASVNPPLGCAAAAADADAGEDVGGVVDGVVDCDDDAVWVVAVVGNGAAAAGAAVARGSEAAAKACCTCCGGGEVEVPSGVMPAAFWKREMMKEG